ncbi:MAG: hypothetical protein AAF943_16725 [Pseudomonadota bacterium]
MFKRITAVVAGFAALLAASIAAAQDYPPKPLNEVVSFAAAGNAAIMARREGEALSQQLGVPVNIINKPNGAHIPAVVSA